MFIHTYIYIYIVFPTGGNGGSPPTSLKFAHPPNLEKFLPSRLPPSHQIFIPPPTTKQQLSSYNLIKAAFLAAVIALASFFF